jgi:hypothetical protein
LAGVTDPIVSTIPCITLCGIDQWHGIACITLAVGIAVDLVSVCILWAVILVINNAITISIRGRRGWLFCRRGGWRRCRRSSATATSSQNYANARYKAQRDQLRYIFIHVRLPKTCELVFAGVALNDTHTTARLIMMLLIIIILIKNCNRGVAG